MDNNIVDVTFHYTETINVKQDKRSFLDAVKVCFEAPGLKDHTPIKVVFNSTKKTLVFDENKFRAYASGEMSLEELVGETQCDGMYRNTVDIELTKHDIIEHASLWKRIGDTLFLIDEDRSVPIKFPDTNFIEV